VKKALLIITALIVASAAVWFFAPHKSAAPKPTIGLTREHLTLRDGRLYVNGADTPFDGFLVEKYPNGALKSRSAIAQGKLNGLSEGWHTNGVLQVREHFVADVSDGLREKFYDTGARLSEAQIVHGQIDGLFRRWDEQAELVEEIRMTNGQPDGEAWAFYPSGFVKARAQMQSGKLVARQSWNDGEWQRPLAAAR
jgi:antitoxin component YwqK of YwqJK toxin-antitoxin module